MATFNADRYRKSNPWVIVNVQNSIARCGRFPNREAAEAAAANYRGGVVEVNADSKTVYVSEVPSL